MIRGVWTIAHEKAFSFWRVGRCESLLMSHKAGSGPLCVHAFICPCVFMSFLHVSTHMHGHRGLDTE